MLTREKISKIFNIPHVAHNPNCGLHVVEYDGFGFVQ